MAKYTKLLQFDKKTAQRIMERDGGCIFCKMHFHMECTDWMALGIKDIMHYIPKSSQGLGIEENGAEGCRYHHSLMDNGNRGLRDEMLDLMKEYLQSRYPDWNENKLRYNKYSYLEVSSR